MSRVTEYLLNICLVRSFRSLFLIGIPVFLNSSLSLRYSVLHASWKAGSLYKALDILSMQSFLSGMLLPWRFQFTCNVWKNLELVWNISLGPFLVILENQNTFFDMSEMLLCRVKRHLSNRAGDTGFYMLTLCLANFTYSGSFFVLDALGFSTQTIILFE